ncbi:MAG: xylulokinase [Acidimicrobiales bacterium]|nr:xylulokinase [Acidimicrobiales bacterium]
MPLVAGVDSSTQSTKVELRDLGTGKVIGAGRAAHPIAGPPRSEQAPDDWWAALATAMAAALASAGPGGRASDVVAVAVAAQQHGLVVLDGQGEVLRPAKLWNDTEAAEDSDRLVARLGATKWAEACGSVPVPAFTIAKLSWLRRCEPDTFARIGHVLLPHDWLTHCLTNRFVTDRGDASGTGYWSPRGDRYRIDLLELVDSDKDWAGALPTVLGPWDQAGSLTAEAANTLGLPVGTPVAAGTGDNMAGALGTGLRPGEVAISVGTSGTVFAPSEQPVQDPTGAIAGFADATGRYLPLVCTLNATLVTAAISRLLSVDHSGLDDLALAAPSGCDGLVLVPYLVGERTPNRPNATGTLEGIRSDVSRELLARAAFEGVVCSLLEGLDALEAAGVPTRTGRLVLLGGGARSSAYRQILATLASRPVTIPYDNEIVSAGAAVQAAVLATGSGPTEVAEAWDLREGETAAPGTSSATSGEVRRRFAEARG